MSLEDDLQKELQWYFYDWEWRSVRWDLWQRERAASRENRTDEVARIHELESEKKEQLFEPHYDRLEEAHWKLIQWVENKIPGAKDWSIIGDPSAFRISISGYVYAGADDQHKAYFCLEGQLCGEMRRDYDWGKLQKEAPEIFENGEPSGDTVLWWMETLNRGGKGQDIFGGGTGLTGYQDATDMALLKTQEFLEKRISKWAAIQQMLSQA